jgi:hypothetical protein
MLKKECWKDGIAKIDVNGTSLYYLGEGPSGVNIVISDHSLAVGL